MKVALVTGASKGIGAAVAEGLAADGYTLALCARNKDRLEAVAERIKKCSKAEAPYVVLHPLDVQDNNAVHNAIKAVSDKFGRIDLLFNNAGISYVGTTSATLNDFDRVIGTNLRGAFSFLQAVVPIMKSQQSGYIFNVASDLGKIGFAEWGVYASSKFGLVGLSESLYKELSPLGIKVTTFCPGWVDTDMAEMSNLEPGEMIQPDDILKAVRWLLTLSPAAVVKELSIGCRHDLG